MKNKTNYLQDNDTIEKYKWYPVENKKGKLYKNLRTGEVSKLEMGKPLLMDIENGDILMPDKKDICYLKK